jgi:6-phosphofructokinase 1
LTYIGPLSKTRDIETRTGIDPRRRIGILTSGGDAPGMNAAIAGACERAEGFGAEVLGIPGGFAGLAERRAVPLTGDEARSHAYEAGTWLGTSRWPALLTADGQEACRRALSALGIDALVVIGGHGSALGAWALAGAVDVAFVPATIDRDIEGTELTIGTSSAIAVALTTIDQLRITGRSLPGRAFLLQTLGAPNGFLADAVANAAGIDLVLVPERPIDLDAIAAALRERAPAGTAIAVMSEAVGDAVRIGEDLAGRAGVRVHPTILGHAQRAAAPSARDRAMGEEAGSLAVDEVAARRSRFIGLARDGRAVASPLNPAAARRHAGRVTLYAQERRS